MDIGALQNLAYGFGFAEMAFCDAAPFYEEKRVVDSQNPLRERRQLHYAPEEDEAEIRSLLVLLWPYQPAAVQDDECVFVDSYYYASNAAYHAAKKIEERMRREGHFAKANVSYPAKAAAVRAGLGIIGKNSLLITPQYGTRIVIILIATDIEAPESPKMPLVETCLQCGRCQKACPSGAIDRNGMSRPHLCLRNHMLEGTIVPKELRNQMNNRLVGCDVCQRVCPMQPVDQQLVQACSFKLDDFVTLDEGVFSESIRRLSEQIGRNAARPQRVRAQAALLAGNTLNPVYLPVLRAWSESPFEAVREHAGWAMEKLVQTEKSDVRT